MVYHPDTPTDVGTIGLCFFSAIAGIAPNRLEKLVEKHIKSLLREEKKIRVKASVIGIFVTIGSNNGLRHFAEVNAVVHCPRQRCSGRPGLLES